MPTGERWQSMWDGLGVAHPPAGLMDELLIRYGEPHRRYHTARHLDECFEKLDEGRSLATFPAEIELALWFHDAIYDVKRRDNEKKSAEWARSSAAAAGLAAESAERVYSLIMATRHETVPGGVDAEILVDVDLSILGAGPRRFDEYERQIRDEYGWVPGFVFRAKRKAILEQFLARAAIFSTKYFFERYEAPARINIARSLEKLSR